MQVKPIGNKNDHMEALREIQKLWGAPRATEAGELLDVLVSMVEVYESENFPIDLPDPIEAIKFRLEQQGIKEIESKFDSLPFYNFERVGRLRHDPI